MWFKFLVDSTRQDTHIFNVKTQKIFVLNLDVKKISNNAAKDYVFRLRTMTILSMLLKEKLVPEKRQNISTLKCLNDPKNEVEGDRKKTFHNTATILVFSSLKCYKLVLENMDENCI